MYRLTKSKMKLFQYNEWLRYFVHNNERRLKLEFSGEDELTSGERKLIFPSICTFQRGEASDGRFLMKTAKEFAGKHDEPVCVEVIECFIREENYHSAYLKEFMSHYGVASKNTLFLDKIFRLLRKNGGFQGEVTVLVTAEIIALSFYTALGKCTNSPALKSICRQMLHDELPHIIFQSYNLSHFRNKHNLLRILLMAGASAAEWTAHHNVYRAGGYGFGRYMQENMGYLRQSIIMARQKL